MKLIVGLGNKGKEYDKTRHNIGFMAVDIIADSYNIKIDKKKFDGLYNKININNEQIIFLKPQKYINLSGDVIKKYLDYFKIEIKDLLIIHDDLDIEIGKFKIKKSGSSGGHNGLKNIEVNLKTRNYNRIKIGISNNKNIDTVNYVLGTLTKEEQIKLDNVLNIMPELFNDYLNISFDNLMNKYNKKN